MEKTEFQLQAMAPDCPKRSVLADVALGKLPGGQMAAVAEHVEQCPACQDALAGFDALNDSLLRDLQHAPAVTLAPVCRQLEEQIRTAGAFRPAASTAVLSARPVDDPLPRRLGQYDLLEVLGRGGMGVVYKAIHLKLKRPVAVKVLSARGLHDVQSVERFHREMEAVALLDHAQIVRALDANEADGRQFLVMELVDGVDLARLVGEHGPLSVADACRFVAQAASALQYAHEHGLVHRDVKPSNLMLDRQGQVKLLDLGLARLQPIGDTADDMTEAGQLLGTADFMAPEQAVDPRLSDPRSDIYSLGCTLFFLLTGRAPYAAAERDTPIQRLLAHSQQPVPLLRASRADAPQELSQLVARMMAKRPEHRPATAAEVASTLAGLADTDEARRAEPPKRRAWLTRPKTASVGTNQRVVQLLHRRKAPMAGDHRLLFVLLGVVLLVVVLVAGSIAAVIFFAKRMTVFLRPPVPRRLFVPWGRTISPFHKPPNGSAASWRSRPTRRACSGCSRCRWRASNNR